jgi:hypothetical protein
MPRGRPFAPGNQFGRGRPKGSPNKQTQPAQKLFEKHAAAIVALAINRSREDPQMLRMLAGRIVPRQRDLPVNLGRLPTNTLEDLDRASATTLKKATSGKISVSEAREVFTMIEIRRSALLAQGLEKRLSALENALGLSPEGSRSNPTEPRVD